MSNQPRILSPNIVLSPDGVPVILGTGISTLAIYREWKLCHYPNGDNKTMDAIADDTGACVWEVHEALGFEAGRRYAKEQRKAKRQRRKESARNGALDGLHATEAPETATTAHAGGDPFPVGALVRQKRGGNLWGRIVGSKGEYLLYVAWENASGADLVNVATIMVVKRP